jgi:hypothetical protein
MISLLWLVLTILASPFKSKYQLEAENVALRHQVVVLRRQVRGRTNQVCLCARPKADIAVVRSDFCFLEAYRISDLKRLLRFLRK